MIIICMDAHQRVITDCNQCECLAISVYVWQCRVLSMYASTYKANSSFFPFFFITQIIRAQASKAQGPLVFLRIIIIIFFFQGFGGFWGP